MLDSSITTTNRMTCDSFATHISHLHLLEFLVQLFTVATTPTIAMSNKRSNVSLLTEGAKYIKRAKKAREEQVEEIKFDDSARQ